MKEVSNSHLRLGDDRNCALFQRCDRRCAARSHHSGAHDNRNGILRHDLMQEREAVHARQFQVEKDHVGPLPGHLLHGDERVCSNRDLDTLFLRQNGGYDLPHESGVIDHKNVDGLRQNGHCAGSGHCKEAGSARAVARA